MSDDPRPAEEAEAIARLAPEIRLPLYRMGWSSLHPIQVASIDAIYETDNDLILSAQTAAGKTEAAFLPILSKVVESRDVPGVRAVYAGPLKALINDQFLRLDRLCEAAEIPVHRWHGDVGQAAKARLFEAPSGVLLITPESIESLLVNRAEALGAAFANLEFVVIDEMHAFLGDGRGAQLRSVLARLSRRASRPVRTVGLSATLGDPEAARRWLRPRDPDRVTLIADRGPGKEVKIRVNGYLTTEDESTTSTLPGDVFDAFLGKTALIFGESKARLERLAGFARDEATRRGVVDPFRIHHGSLSKVEREEAEDALRSGHPTATFCTSTLEMGIDVGDVEAVGQIGAPRSVAALIQRVGRSGRKEGRPRVLRMFLDEEAPEADAPVAERLLPDFLRGVVSVELLLARWCEPAEVDRLHLSTLVQQVLSLIAETGGIRADALFDQLVTRGPFVGVDRPTFVALLRSLGTADLIEQAPEGPMILGLKGEPIVRSFDFYATFRASEDYRVVALADGREIGRAPFAPGGAADARIVLGGRTWRVAEVDRKRRQLAVEPAPGGDLSSPAWSRGGGMAEVHPRVDRAVRDLLRSDAVPPYLDPSAAKMLADARALAGESGALDGDLIDDGPRVAWFPWLGSRVDRTLRGLGVYVAGMKVRDPALGLTFDGATAADVRAAYRAILDAPPSAESLAARFPDLAREKYDAYLPDDLLARSFALDGLDLPGALDAIRSLVEPAPTTEPPP